MKFFLLSIACFFITKAAVCQNWEKIIENKTFDAGLILEDAQNTLVRNCTIRNKKGNFGVRLLRCKNVRLEGCSIRNIGNESMSDYFSGSVVPKDEKDYPQKRGRFHAKGISIENSFDIIVSDCEITDVFGTGILINADDYTKTGNITIEKSRIAYIYDDGIKFTVKGDQDDNGGKKSLPFKGGIIRNNVLHDIGLGTSQLPFARHGMYLKARDILVEGNTVYNCFYGQGISLRNAGVIRNNRLWNCYNCCISYWAQTSTEGSTKTVIIEGNQCRQDYEMDFRMRHISSLDKKPSTPGTAMIQVAFMQNQADAVIDRFVIRGNTCVAGLDYASPSALIGGVGSQPPHQQVTVEDNILLDARPKKVYYSNITPGIKSMMKWVADRQLATFEEQTNRTYKWPNDHKLWAWTNGTLYTGMAQWVKIADDTLYWHFLKDIAQKLHGKLGPNPYHADDLCVGQMYAELFHKYGDTALINPTIKSLQFIMNNPKSTPLDFWVPCNQDRWSWCDALFMAPTTFARIGKITGDKRYFTFMDKEFWATYDTLYSKKDSLFFRDTRYKTKKEANGQNVYWARGNGWVIGGLTVIIDNLPDRHPTKKNTLPCLAK